MIGKKKLSTKSLPPDDTPTVEMPRKFKPEPLTQPHGFTAKPEVSSRVPAKVAAVMARGGWVTDTEKISVAVLTLREIADGAEVHAAALARNALLVVR